MQPATGISLFSFSRDVTDSLLKSPSNLGLNHSCWRRVVYRACGQTHGVIDSSFANSFWWLACQAISSFQCFLISGSVHVQCCTVPHQGCVTLPGANRQLWNRHEPDFVEKAIWIRILLTLGKRVAQQSLICRAYYVHYMTAKSDVRQWSDIKSPTMSTRFLMAVGIFNIKM